MSTKQIKLNPESYPFLRIAKQYNIDYGDILLHADMARAFSEAYCRGEGINISSPGSLPMFVFLEVIKANIVQEWIRRGEMDWQSGVLKTRREMLWRTLFLMP